MASRRFPAERAPLAIILTISLISKSNPWQLRLSWPLKLFSGGNLPMGTRTCLLQRVQHSESTHFFS